MSTKPKSVKGAVKSTIKPTVKQNNAENFDKYEKRTITRTKLFEKLFTVDEVNKALDEDRVKLEITNATSDGGAPVVYMNLTVDDKSGKTTSSLMIKVGTNTKVSFPPPNEKDANRWQYVKRDKFTNEVHSTSFSFSENSNVELMDMITRLNDVIDDTLHGWVEDKILFNFNVDRDNEDDIGYKPIYALVPTKNENGELVPDKFTRFASIKIDLRTQKKGPLAGKQKTTLQERVDGKLKPLQYVEINGAKERITAENLSEVLKRGTSIESCLLSFDVMSYGGATSKVKGHSASIIMLSGEVNNSSYVIETDDELVQGMLGLNTKEEKIKDELVDALLPTEFD